MVRIEDVTNMREWKGLGAIWNESKWSRTDLFFTELLYGAGAGFVSKSFVLPLNRVCFGLEAARLSSSTNYGQLIRESFHKWLIPHGYGKIPAAALMLSTNELLKKCFLLDNPREHMMNSSVKFFTFGSFVGALSTSIFHPQDLARVLFVRDFAKKKIYDGLIHALESQYINGGPRWIWTGYSVSILGSAIHRGFYFGLFETGKLAFIKVDDDNYNTKIWLLAVGSSLAACLISHPLDVIRKFLIIQNYDRNAPHVRNSIDCIKELRRRGLGYFLSGVPITAMKSLGGAALLIAFHKNRRPEN